MAHTCGVCIEYCVLVVPSTVPPPPSLVVPSDANLTLLSPLKRAEYVTFTYARCWGPDAPTFKGSLSASTCTDLGEIALACSLSALG